MIVVGIKFKNLGKMYYFDPQGKSYTKNQIVVVQTSQGLKCGPIAIQNREIDQKKIKFEINPVIRLATNADLKQYKKNQDTELRAVDIFKEKVEQHNLGMNLIDVELIFDCSKIIFYFTADGRIDFRNVVKDLASIFKTRIELRQVGARDEARALNSIGICGRTLCCSTFLDDFQPVSIKMAKDQKLSLNPSKISGACGRLMCCLKYEQSSYEYLNKNLPNEGDIIKTPSGNGKVLSVSVIKQIVKVSIRKNENDIPSIEFFNVSEIEILKKNSFVNTDEEKYSEELKGLQDE